MQVGVGFDMRRRLTWFQNTVGDEHSMRVNTVHHRLKHVFIRALETENLF
jgi:hypothetical protein